MSDNSDPAETERGVRGNDESLATGEPPPDLLPVARETFGDAFDLARDYARLLATDGVTRGLIGPRETERIWERHLLNCAFAAQFLPERGEVVDIGSGAGLPGLVFAMLRPATRVVLVESMLRRCVFLNECVDQLGLKNVQVVRGRAEDLAGKIHADVATARAVAPLDKLVGWAAGLLRPNGELLAIKGQNAEAELAAADPVLRRLHARSSGVVYAGHDRVVSMTTVVRVVISGRGREEQADERHRRPGVA